MKYNKLIKKFPQFIYKNYDFQKEGQNLSISYFFQIPPKFNFKSRILIKKAPIFNIKDDILERFIFRLGLVEMLNYWKLTCSPKILINQYKLNRGELGFWKKLIVRGMGQYFYENNIDFRRKDFLKIKTKIGEKNFSIPKLNAVFFENKVKILVPLGGGKDSIVVLENLKKEKTDIGLFLLNPREFHRKIAQISRIQNQIIVERTIDPLLFKLNKKGFLNGHVPFSAFLVFLSVILAYLFKYKKIAFGWEKSANEPNLKYLGRWINHQWSKSSEFEKLYNNYLKKFLVQGITVFSPIRQMSELDIAKKFVDLTQYHKYFISCNQAFKMNSQNKGWCAKCPKCLFIFLLLFPFLGEKKIVRIFGKNLFQDKSLEPLLQKLLGLHEVKPFECVGTSEDTKKALRLCFEKIKKEGKKPPPLLKKFFSTYENRKF